MTLQERIDALVRLGERLQEADPALESVMRQTEFANGWFTMANQKKAVAEICTHFLNAAALQQWVAQYSKLTTNDAQSPKTVGLILAGNIPLVGFHDVLCVFVAGHRSLVKLSDKDPYLLRYIFGILAEIDPNTRDYFAITEGYLKGFDAVIATGSNNSARYFDAYFGKYPNIIRKNRNAVAILRGFETAEQLTDLGRDIFTYFGLGCRNVSKIYVPTGYDFVPLLEALHAFGEELITHDKYKNNFDYNFALLILNKIEYNGNGCILMRESTDIASPIAGLFYEYYDDFDSVSQTLLARKDAIQLVVSSKSIDGLPCFKFGEAQKPSLMDYADGVDTLDFLINL